MFRTIDRTEPEATVERDGIHHELLHADDVGGQVIRSTFDDAYEGPYLARSPGRFLLYVLENRLVIEIAGADSQVLHAGRYGWYTPSGTDDRITIVARPDTRLLAVATFDDAWARIAAVEED